MDPIRYRKTTGAIPDLIPTLIRHGSVVVNTGIAFSVPSWKKVKIVNSSHNLEWVLMNEKILGQGNHEELKLELKNLSDGNRPILAGTILAQAIFQSVDLNPEKILLSILNCDAFNMLAWFAFAFQTFHVPNRVLVPAETSMVLNVCMFFTGLPPAIPTGSYAVLNGLLELEMRVTVFNSRQTSVYVQGLIATLQVFPIKNIHGVLV
uniref:Uncharacterized protein n=1 Tax=Ditylenchus dipsaci TaxID=166011 RepID=A0A915DCU2_9BILA